MKLIGRYRVFAEPGSPPVRGAWVEIATVPTPTVEGYGRPLCGGRGLKYL